MTSSWLGRHLLAVPSFGDLHLQFRLLRRIGASRVATGRKDQQRRAQLEQVVQVTTIKPK